ncbi:MAG: fused MFS/spermidine synthase [Xanthobacteraceae bacterium]|nr:fused MFS/spermidine synthase [Xanthobacteraceae bacterium]
MQDRPGQAADAGGENGMRPAPIAVLVYVIAFVTGAIVMSFEMLGSRYLNPYFGSGIYTWASLISTVLAALCVGYFLGGWIADRIPSAAVLGVTVLIGSVYLIFLPAFAGELLELLLDRIDDIKTGSLVSSFAIMFFPVVFLGMYSPFAIRLLLRSTEGSGVTSGMVYGISTAGSIVGTLGTTFLLIPAIGSRAITITLGVAGVLSGLLLIASPFLFRRRGTLGLVAAAVLAAGLLAATAPASLGEELVDRDLRAALLERKDGEIDHIETEYSDIFITKRRFELTMSFQLKGWNYTESVTNLLDPYDLRLAYSRAMTASVLYPDKLVNILMIGLGGGSISTYLGRFLPETAIDTVELDPGVIVAAKKYFGVRETKKVRYLEGDGRVYLTRNKGLYDLILLDAYQGGYVPFHLLTREFYELVKERLTPGGAAAFNIHQGTKLHDGTILTLKAVFKHVDLYPSGRGEVIAMVTNAPIPDRDALAQRAAALQERHGFNSPLPQLLAQRSEAPTLKGELLTDDFAPVNLYDAIGEGRGRKK